MPGNRGNRRKRTNKSTEVPSIPVDNVGTEIEAKSEETGLMTSERKENEAAALGALATDVEATAVSDTSVSVTSSKKRNRSQMEESDSDGVQMESLLAEFQQSQQRSNADDETLVKELLELQMVADLGNGKWQFRVTNNNNQFACDSVIEVEVFSAIKAALNRSAEGTAIEVQTYWKNPRGLSIKKGCLARLKNARPVTAVAGREANAFGAMDYMKVPTLGFLAFHQFRTVYKNNATQAKHEFMTVKKSGRFVPEKVPIALNIVGCVATIFIDDDKEGRWKAKTMQIFDEDGYVLVRAYKGTPLYTMISSQAQIQDLIGKIVNIDGVYFGRINVDTIDLVHETSIRLTAIKHATMVTVVGSQDPRAAKIEKYKSQDGYSFKELLNYIQPISL